MQFGDGHPDGCGPFQMEWPSCYLSQCVCVSEILYWRIIVAISEMYPPDGSKTIRPRPSRINSGALCRMQVKLSIDTGDRQTNRRTFSSFIALFTFRGLIKGGRKVETRCQTGCIVYIKYSECVMWWVRAGGIQHPIWTAGAGKVHWTC